MARYIDADKAIKHLKDDCMTKYPMSYSNGISAAIKEIGKLPSADVVPSIEIEKIFEEIETEITEAIKCNYKRRTEYYTKERFKKEDGEFINMVEGKLSALRGIEGFVEELKKKYTGEK